jgi:hypothetical protein
VETIEETMVKRNLEYIKLEWTDIHHSRQQEWGALVIIAGIFYAIARVEPDYPGNPLEAKIFLGLLGVFSAFLGAWICWQHHEILQQKISVIVRLERQVGMQYPVRNVWFPVQVLLFWLFGGICSTFVGLTLGYVVESCKYYHLIPWTYGIGLAVFFLGFVGFAVCRRKKAMERLSYGYSHPFYAETQDLEQCLGHMGEIPLKLVVGGTLDRSGIKEVVWEDEKWTWHRSDEDESIIKPVLLNRCDVFQFSLANTSSRQDWHQHSSTFEVYFSDNPIELDYEEQGMRKGLKVNRGVLIVPPKIPHKVNLSGITFVFQATLAGGGLGEDKTELGES